MKKENWSNDPWQCPFCSYLASPLVRLVNHFRERDQNGDNTHSYRYIRTRFRIEPIKRLNIKVYNYSGQSALQGYDESRDPNNSQLKYTPFETKRRKH